MSWAEAAEFSKLADTTYRDVNIALANEFARYAERVGVDIHEVIAAANSQPYSHIHQPGLGVGGHCIPVYPHFLLSRAPELEMVGLARRTNDGQLGVAIRTLQKVLGGLEGVPILVLGLTYRHGVKELAYSRALPLIERLTFHGARASRPTTRCSRDAEIADVLRVRVALGRAEPFRAIVTQTADPLFRASTRPGSRSSRLLFDGRNSLRDRRCRTASPTAASASRPRSPPRVGLAGGIVRRAVAIARPAADVRIVSVVGTRPQLIKAAALLPALRARHDEILVDTGQHWDEAMAGAFFAELGLPRPDHSLGIGGGGRPSRPPRMLTALEPILVAERPDAVLVVRRHELDARRRAGRGQGCAAGRPRRGRAPLLRPDDARGGQPRRRRPPLELAVRADADGRRRTSPPRASSTASRSSATSFRTSPRGSRPEVRRSRRRCGPAGRGRPAAARAATSSRPSTAPRTAHRGAPGLGRPAGRARPRAAAGRAAAPPRDGRGPGGHGASLPDVHVVGPLGYRTSLAQLHAAAVVTDSGGVQREAAWLGVPCLILRDTTEWAEAVADSGGLMVVVGAIRRGGRARRAGRGSAPDGGAAVDRAACLDIEPAGAAVRSAALDASRVREPREPGRR